MTEQTPPVNIWTHFQGEGKAYGFTGSHGRHAHLLRMIERFAAGGSPVVLNVGIGDGNFEREALRRGWSVASLDPDEDAIQAISTAGVRGQVGSITCMPFADDSFDFVVASEVLEHLTADERSLALREIARTLKSGGRLLGTVPLQEDLALSRTVCPQCNHVFHRWGHTTSFGLESMRVELAAVFGEVTCYRAALVEFAGRSFRGKLKSTIRWVLGRFGAAIAVPSLVFIARKLPDAGLAKLRG